MVKCKDHPMAPHGFLRQTSHDAGRYVCECEWWSNMESMSLQINNDYLAEYKPHILEIKDHTGKEIVRITYEGNIYWNGREVETDQEYRDTMLYIARRLFGDTNEQR